MKTLAAPLMAKENYECVYTQRVDEDKRISKTECRGISFLKNKMKIRSQ